jgi:phosphohistidine phosphatase
MKTLILMRHAKSSWKDHTLGDVDRPLKKRGKKDAQEMAKILVDKELLPQKMLVSSAKRARRTAEIVIEETKKDIPVEYLDQLYMAEVSVYFDLLSNLPDDLERVMVVGHNPGLESVVQFLRSEIESMPSCAMALISLPIKSWKELTSTTKGDLIDLYKPKQLHSSH